MLSLFICLLLASLVVAQPDINNPFWRYAWGDDFNGNTLDTTKWTARNIDGNEGNGELQWYSSGQVTVSGGNMVITAVEVETEGKAYTSGWVDSQDLGMFTTGARFTARAKMAGGIGMWPAIWMLSDNTCWPVGVEYDIMEYRGSYAGQYAMNYHYSGSNQCCAPGVSSSCVTYYGHTYSGSADLSEGFHNYTMDLWPTNFTYYFDGVAQWTIQTGVNGIPQSPTPHYWIINSAVGGGYPGDPTSPSEFPNEQLVDSISVHVWRPSCAGNPCSGNGCCNTTTMLCTCNAGWQGTYCEVDMRTATHNFAVLSSLELAVNGWGNPYSLYLTKNCQIKNYQLTLTISTSGCPSSCGNLPYGAGAWTTGNSYGYGTFTWAGVRVQTAVSGTALSLAASGNFSGMQQQIAWTLDGDAPTQATLWTFANNYQYNHSTINLGFDFTKETHTYAAVYLPNRAGVNWYVDNKLVWSDDLNVPFGLLTLGAYYTAEPDWYGPLNYQGPIHAYLTSATWQTAGGVATC